MLFEPTDTRQTCDPLLHCMLGWRCVACRTGIQIQLGCVSRWRRVLACLLPNLDGCAIHVGGEIGDGSAALHAQHLSIICLRTRTAMSHCNRRDWTGHMST